MKTFPTLTSASLGLVLLAGCNSDSTAKKAKEANQNASSAQQVYVAPGKLDDYYAFLSGGQSGSIFVYGIPSCRFITEIPIFEPRAGQGYANNPNSETYKRLASTGPLWGDTHHPVLSQTDGRYDGHWLWINDKANARVAKIDLRTFEVAEIKTVPNIQGAHGLAAYLPSCHYVFFTSYNTENAIASEGMIERDRDAVGAIDVPLAEKAIAEGKFTLINGARVIESEKVPGVLT